VEAAIVLVSGGGAAIVFVSREGAEIVLVSGGGGAENVLPSGGGAAIVPPVGAAFSLIGAAAGRAVAECKAAVGITESERFHFRLGCFVSDAIPVHDGARTL
jgi:hypothetical protein